MGDDKKKMWGGRFNTSQSNITEKISSSIHFDARLYKHDIRGSLAHAKMLTEMGILSKTELEDITKGLHQIEKEIDEGTFSFSESLEDVHMNIESMLTQKIGDAGKKLHTARSRNDQVSVDMRMYIIDEGMIIKKLLVSLIGNLIDISEKNIDVIMPGYTHLQIAQPVRLSHHLLAYGWKFSRDLKRLENSIEAANMLPLGSGALSGVNYNNDREFLQKELNFNEIMLNSMDAVSDRDFILDFLYFSAVLGTHMSRFCEELILWSTAEFGFITMDDAVTTGSSIMPQKRNPDIAELVRGKTGRLYGNLMAILTVLKGLPMTYNRDLQEDKEPLFDSIDTVILSLEGINEMIISMTINKERMKNAVYSNFSTATDLADYLARKNVPFRESHEIVGSIVHHCEKNNIDFFNLSFDSLKAFSSVFEEDILELLNPEESTERKLSMGSTATKEIKNQIKVLREIIKM